VQGVQEGPNLFRHVSAAADFWAATAADVKKRDEAGYQRDIGSYEAALGSYQQEAIQLGFKSTGFCTVDIKFLSRTGRSGNTYRLEVIAAVRMRTVEMNRVA
jgi:hypothetical protein